MIIRILTLQCNDNNWSVCIDEGVRTGEHLLPEQITWYKLYSTKCETKKAVCIGKRVKHGIINTMHNEANEHTVWNHNTMRITLQQDFSGAHCRIAYILVSFQCLYAVCASLTGNAINILGWLCVWGTLAPSGTASGLTVSPSDLACSSDGFPRSYADPAADDENSMMPLCALSLRFIFLSMSGLDLWPVQDHYVQAIS
jgi:hypothetical protein